MASTYLSKTPTAGDLNTWTWSGWVKRGKLGSASGLFGARNGSQPEVYQFSASDTLQVYNYNGSSFPFNLQTNRVFRDTNSWYHIVISVDTTQTTSTDRIKIYVNGEQETSLQTTTYPSQNFNTFFNSAVVNYVGTSSTADANYFDGSLTHVHFIDGTAYDADTFGETDSTTGEWKPKTAPSVTYGTNGFFLKFENASSFGEDSSGNDNDFTTNGTGTQLVDTPTNVFATMNPLVNSGISYENTNLSVAGGADNNFGWGTLPGRMNNASAGWYYEMKVDCGTTIGSEGRSWFF